MNPFSLCTTLLREGSKPQVSFFGKKRFVNFLGVHKRTSKDSKKENHFSISRLAYPLSHQTPLCRGPGPPAWTSAM